MSFADQSATVWDSEAMLSRHRARTIPTQAGARSTRNIRAETAMPVAAVQYTHCVAKSAARPKVPVA